MKTKHIRKKSRIKFLTLILLFPIFTFCQVNQNDLTKDEKVYLKTIVCSDMFLQTNSIDSVDVLYLYENFYNIFVIDKISAKGFKDVQFYKIQFKISTDSLIKIYQNFKTDNSSFYLREFVMNDNQIFLKKKDYLLAKVGGFYKLKGFCYSDIYNFFAMCYNTNSYFNEEIQDKLRSKSNLSIEKRTQLIIPMLNIEGMDLQTEIKKYFH